MAVTENLYTGNGSTTNYSFTFPYLATTDIKVSLNSVITTAYTFANATTVQFNTAPANGVAIRIYRDTDDSNLNATFYSGSAIRAQDLNDNFTQNLYVTQEAVNTADSATTTAASALSTANTALSNSTAAVSTANTAASNAATAVSTANTASANASTAVSTANAATATANTALSNSTAAISTANTASSNATAAVNTANSAASDASTALSLVNNVIDYQIILNVASIPGSPVDGDRIEVVDSTGIESFTPLSGIPGGFTGAAGLSVRMSYDGTGSTWVWYDYSPTDPDSRYILDSTGTVTSTNILNGTIVDADISASAEIAVSKLADGAARQLLQTDAAGTGVEWTSNVDIPGTLDVVGAATFDSSATIVGDLTVDTNTLYVDSTNNRVGVGTTSPGYNLHVSNTASIGGAKVSGSSNSTGESTIILANSLYSNSSHFDLTGGSLTLAAGAVNTNRVGNNEGRTYTGGDVSIFAGNAQYAGTTGNTVNRGNIIFGQRSVSLAGAFTDTELARLDSSGRLLVGTSSASGGYLNDNTLLHIQSGGVGAGISIHRPTTFSATAAPYIFISRSRGTPATAVVSGDRLGEIVFAGADGTDVESTAAKIYAEVDGTPGANDMPGRLVFSTTADGASSPTERMRIASDGGITTTAGATPGASTFGTAIGRAGNPGLLESFRDGTATTSVCNFGGPLGNALIKCDGDLENTNNRYTGISDIKLKENIADAGSQWNDLKAIRVRSYNFKEETGYNTHTQIGLVAQEVELVSPGLVGETLNDDTGEVTKNVAYSVLYMKAVKALQEAMERIETLEAKVAALESA